MPLAECNEWSGLDYAAGEGGQSYTGSLGLTGRSGRLNFQI